MVPPSPGKPTEADTKLLELYKEKRWIYGHLAERVAQFLKWKVEEIFSGSTLPVLHLVQNRAKSLDSLKKNLEASVYASASLDQIHDLAGVRVIFHFEDDLLAFCDDRARFGGWFGKYSSDNLRRITGSLTPSGRQEDVPGYDTYHLPLCIARTTAFWESLKEHDRNHLEGLHCEVQLRTILRHAWAEAEHDLRYKVKKLTSYPLTEQQERLFVLLAAGVEDTDNKLVDIKDELIDVLRILEPAPTPPFKWWRYQEPPWKSAFRVGSVGYHYEKLHVPPAGCGMDSGLKIEEVNTLFDVDATMQAATTVDRYKQRMWEKLKIEEPQFVNSIHYDSSVVRVCGWKPEPPTVRLQAAHYSDQVVTNHKRALSKTIPGLEDVGRKVSDLARDDCGELRPFESSPLSNTVGVACVVRLERQFWVAALRSSSVAFEPSSWGCPVSGALEWSEIECWAPRDFDGWFRGGMAREFVEELGLRVKPADMHYLGFFRELGRAGKPQVFFYIDLEEYSCNHVQSRWRTYKSPSSEYQELEFFSTEAALEIVSADEDKIQRHIGSARLAEELRMNLVLALQYLKLI